MDFVEIMLRRLLQNELGMASLTACCYLAVSALALAPTSVVSHLPVVSDKVQHLFAFLAIGVLTVVSAGRSVGIWGAALIVVVLAAALELGQLLSPTRSVDFIDFVASSAGAMMGVSLGALAQPYWRRPAS